MHHEVFDYERFGSVWCAGMLCFKLSTWIFKNDQLHYNTGWSFSIARTMDSQILSVDCAFLVRHPWLQSIFTLSRLQADRWSRSHLFSCLRSPVVVLSIIANRCLTPHKLIHYYELLESIKKVSFYHDLLLRAVTLLPCEYYDIRHLFSWGKA